MLLKLICYITFLVFLAQCQTNSTNLDYSDQCARVSDYQENDEDYCYNFNNTCTTIFERKQVCQSMELSCSQEQKSGSCVLTDCNEYTPDVEIRKLQEQVENWPREELYYHQCSNRITSVYAYFDFVNYGVPKASDGETITEKVEMCCTIEYRRMEEKVGNVCRNTSDPIEYDGCKFHFCSAEEMEQKKGESVDKHTVRLTEVSEKDIDVTQLAVDGVFYAYIAQNISRAFCPNFHSRCLQTFERYFGNGDFEIKESTCIPDIGGKVPQTACILIRSSDVKRNEITEEVGRFEGTSATGETLDVTELAIDYASRYSKDDGAYCEHFMEGCTLVMHAQNIMSHRYQRKEVTCNRCVLVKSSETDESQILTKYPQPNTKDQQKLRLSEETEHLIPMQYGNYAMRMAYTLPYSDITQKIEYHCTEVQKILEAKIENVCRVDNDTFPEFQANPNRTRYPCNFHLCTPQEELEKKPTTHSMVVRHTPVSEKDMDMTTLVTDITLMNVDITTSYYTLSNYCREFRNNCWNILDRFFYTTLDYQVKENTCQPDKIEKSAEGYFKSNETVPPKSACILVRVGDK